MENGECCLLVSLNHDLFKDIRDVGVEFDLGTATKVESDIVGYLRLAATYTGTSKTRDIIIIFASAEAANKALVNLNADFWSNRIDHMALLIDKDLRNCEQVCQPPLDI